MASVAGAATISTSVVVSYVLVTLLWGLNWPAMKVAVSSFDPWTFRTLVLIAAGCTLLALARVRGHRLALPAAHRLAIMVPALMVTGWHMFSAYGLTFIGGGRAAIIAFTMPLWTLVLSFYWLGERPSWVRTAGLGLGLVGLGLLLADEVDRLRAAPWGVVLMLAAALCWAIGTVAVKARDWQASVLVLTAWQLLLGVVPIALVWVWRGAELDLAAIPPPAWLGFLYTTFIAMVFCFYSYVRFVTLLPATVAAIGVMAIPVVGLIGSATLLGETLGAFDAAALLCVVGGQALAILMPRRT